MKLDEYELFIEKIDIYDKQIEQYVKYAQKKDIEKLIKILVHYIGLTNEVGEIGGKIKKSIRDENGLLDFKQLLDECGDVEWYLTRLENHLGKSKNDVIDENYAKLLDRKTRNKLQGSGDGR